MWRYGHHEDRPIPVLARFAFPGDGIGAGYYQRDLDEETTYSDTLEVAVWDPSETNPFDATKRMALSLLPAGGGGGGATTFVDLTDTPAAIVAGQCVQGNGRGDCLDFRRLWHWRGRRLYYIRRTDGRSLGIRQFKLSCAATASSALDSLGHPLRCDLILGRHWNRIFQAATSLCLLAGTTGHVLTKTATGRDWAAGAGGGAFSRTELGTLTTSTTSGDIAPIALSEALSPAGM